MIKYLASPPGMWGQVVFTNSHSCSSKFFWYVEMRREESAWIIMTKLFRYSRYTSKVLVKHESKSSISSSKDSRKGLSFSRLWIAARTLVMYFWRLLTAILWRRNLSYFRFKLNVALICTHFKASLHSLISCLILSSEGSSGFCSNLIFKHSKIIS